jgi:hypothetical protein
MDSNWLARQTFNVAFFGVLALVLLNSMPPKRKIPLLERSSEPSKRPKTTCLTDQLIAEFGDLKSIQFEPFQPEQIPPAEALLPSNFPSHPLPSDYFNLFFTSDLFDLIVRNTNKYAAIQRLDKEEKGRE